MEKLRKQYAKNQQTVETDHTQLTHERVKKLLNYANKHFEQAVNNAEYQHLDELDFYKEKYTEVNRIFEANHQPKKHQAELQAAFRQNFAAQGQPNPAFQETPQGVPSSIQPHPGKSNHLSSVPEERHDRSNQRVNHQIEQGGGGSRIQRVNSKDMLNNFFDGKRSEIQKSQLGFKSVLNNVPPAPAHKKYPVKSSALKSGLSPPPQQSPLRSSGANNDEADKLKRELKELKRKLQEKQTQREFNHGLLQVQKRDYKETIRSLTEKVENLQTQNYKLKEESESQPSQRNQYAPIPPPQREIPAPMMMRNEAESVAQYGMTFKSNNMAAIKNRNMVKPRMEGDQAPRTYDPYARKQEQDDALSHRSKGYSENRQTKEINLPLELEGSFRKETNPSLQRSFGNPGNPQKLADEPLKYGSRDPSVGAVSSNLRFGESQIVDEAKNIAIRSKISFFRKSLVLYRGNDVQIAVKSSDLIHFQSRKISFYVNNKDRFQREADIHYKFNPDYYSVRITKELNSVPGSGQGRQDIEVTLKCQTDLDNMIQATLIFNKREFNFLVPAMFIAFTESRPPQNNFENYERKRIEPIYQFSNVYSAEEVLPIDMEFEGRNQVGRTYGVSKYHQGYVTLRWVRGKLQVETIRPWKLFLSYLLFKDY